MTIAGAFETASSFWAQDCLVPTMEYWQRQKLVYIYPIKPFLCKTKLTGC